MELEYLQQRLATHGMEYWARRLELQLHSYYSQLKHGDYPVWRQTIANLPEVIPSKITLDADKIQIGTANDCAMGAQLELEKALGMLTPWRKGPFELFGIEVDAEWRSDYKWHRLQDKITPLKGRSVLDVGCGNGYFGWRMLAAGAEFVIGLDPVLRYFMQYQLIKKYLWDQPFQLLPFRLDDLLDCRLQFDSVFSMGVLYHHPKPESHIQQLFDCLRPGGELILETLVIDEDYGAQLQPTERYARMKNISIIPSVPTLMDWLGKYECQQTELLDISTTTTAEQRVTRWSGTQSLADFLDENDKNLTIEGYPAPKRAIVVIQK